MGGLGLSVLMPKAYFAVPYGISTFIMLVYVIMSFVVSLMDKDSKLDCGAVEISYIWLQILIWACEFSVGTQTSAADGDVADIGHALSRAGVYLRSVESVHRRSPASALASMVHLRHGQLCQSEGSASRQVDLPTNASDTIPQGMLWQV